MKNYKIWIIIVTLLLIVNSVLLAIIWFSTVKPPISTFGKEPKDVLISALKLTPKQQYLFDGMRTRHMQITSKLNEANHALRDSLFDNIKTPLADTALISSLTKKISDNQAGLEKATLYHFRELRAVLTADQQVKFDSIINDVLRMMAGSGHMQGPPGRRGPVDDRFPPWRGRIDEGPISPRGEMPPPPPPGSERRPYPPPGN